MIIVKLIGGLGNQMFQYAAGRALAQKHGVPLALDLSELNKDANGAYTQRGFALDAFSVNAVNASNVQVAPFLKFQSHQWLRIAQRYMPSLFPNVYFAESGSHYQNAFQNLGPNTYLNGYWQSEKYFENIRQLLINDFKLTQVMPDDVLWWHNKVASLNSVAMHVRRGDYVHLPTAKAFHGVCSVQYYKNAFQKLQEGENEIAVFVFSDDIGWCRQNLNFTDNIQFVSHKSIAAWDLHLMSVCKHQVIANSSFSWWAAWLNQHTNKRVYVPEYWFNNIRTKAIDILAQNWEIIEG